MSQTLLKVCGNMENIKTLIFTKEEMDQIHEATLKVLAEPGVLVNNEEARMILKKAGCDVNEETRVVKMPRQVVENALKTAPPEFTMYSRDGKHNVRMVSDGSIVNDMTFGVGTRMITYAGHDNYVCRESVLQDIYDISKVVDSCDNIDWFCSPVSAMDLATDPTRSLKEVRAIVANSSKPLLLDPDPSFLEDYFEIEKICYNGDEKRAMKEPFFLVGGCPSSPLQLDDVFCQLAIHGPDYGMPFMCLSMAMGAASSPIFLAGTMVTHNAEVLAGITLVQLANPGALTFYGSSTTSFDFYHDAAPVGSPELALISAAVAQLAHYYKMPSIVAGT